MLRPYTAGVIGKQPIAWREPLWGMVWPRIMRTLEVMDWVRPRFWVRFVLEPMTVYALIVGVAVLYAVWATDGAVVLPLDGLVVPLQVLVTVPAICLSLALVLAPWPARVRMDADGIRFGFTRLARVRASDVLHASLQPARRTTLRLHITYARSRRAGARRTVRSLVIGVPAGVPRERLAELLGSWEAVRSHERVARQGAAARTAGKASAIKAAARASVAAAGRIGSRA